MPDWTPEQEAVFAAVGSTHDHVNVQAVAGSGKTTTAVEAASRATEKRVGFVAFNSHIANALKARLPATAQAMTLHSLGLRALTRSRLHSQQDPGKGVRILSGVEPEAVRTIKGHPKPWPWGRTVLDLVGAAKSTLATLHGPLAPDGWRDLAEARGVEVPRENDFERVAGVAERVLTAMLEDHTSHDFDDMLWVPIMEEMPVQEFGLLMVDEAQDLSPVQRELACRAAAGRMVIIGDVAQSIYAFTGADPDSIPIMRERLAPAGLSDCPLTVTFRCPASHVALAQRVVSHIQARHGAPEGVVREIAAEQLPAEVRPGDMILARRNAPLVGLALRLLAKGVRVRMVKRDIGTSMLGLLDQLNCRGSIHDLVASLNDWLEARIDTLERKGAAEGEFLTARDRYAALLELASSQPTVEALRNFCATLGADEKTPAGEVVSLSSIHRAKGLEADRVFVADPDCLPMVLTCRRCQGDGCVYCDGRGTRQNAVQVQQERNLLYVALTRARQEMVFVDGLPAGLRHDY